MTFSFFFPHSIGEFRKRSSYRCFKSCVVSRTGSLSKKFDLIRSFVYTHTCFSPFVYDAYQGLDFNWFHREIEEWIENPSKVLLGRFQSLQMVYDCQVFSINNWDKLKRVRLWLFHLWICHNNKNVFTLSTLGYSFYQNQKTSKTRKRLTFAIMENMWQKYWKKMESEDFFF